MYQWLLCWRYLRSRYIALASIISVTLGVATMIVVNSVMSGFTHEMQGRIHGILSDIVFESIGLEGFADAPRHMHWIRQVAGGAIEGMTPTVHVPAMLMFRVQERWIMRQVNFIGIDEATYSSVSDFGRYLQHPANRERLGFQLREGGYDTADHQAGPGASERVQMRAAGWGWRRERARIEQAALATQGHTPAPGGRLSVSDPFQAARALDTADSQTFDPQKDQHTGIVMGIALAAFRGRDGEDRFLLLPGDDVRVTFPNAATPPQGVSDVFTVVDFYESKMSEYDASFAFVPLQELQRSRGMIDPTTGIALCNSIQIKLKPGADLDRVRDKLRAYFPPELYSINTWRDKQGPLLAAVHMETAILNVLLFLIIAVAGFGILAIFFMIVVEKTRDIGILKSLGASGRGIMGIFLGYGLSLGVVGSGMGLILGLVIVLHINEIADLVGRITGEPLFDPTVYYFQEIPTIVSAWTVSWIVIGAVGIAVLASVLPARRASRLHPVEALRYE
jgi:lipoprotein-releasing system permease protein